MGAGYHQRSPRPDLCRDRALDAERSGEHRVRFGRALRSAHRIAAVVDRVESVPLDRPDGRRQRREAEPRWRQSAAARRTSVPDSKRNPVIPPAAAADVPLDNTRAQVDACVDIAARAGLDFLVLDQTRPDVEVPVVRVIVPGMRHFYRRFAPGRLYDVPVNLGLRDRPSLESGLTPFLPHT
ncbi:YcaO-like family protein [Bradyrhizobium sp. 27S5]